MTTEALAPEQIRSARKSLGLSQAQLGEAIGVIQVTVSNWETGKGTPSPVQLLALRSYFQNAKAEPARDPSTAPQAEYGEWLSSMRSKVGLSRAALAAKAGISALAIWNIETGRTTNPRSTTRKKLERAVGSTAPAELTKAVEDEAQIGTLGQFVDFDPYDDEELPEEPGVYVLYDISERPIYVGESQNIRARIRNHQDKFWFKSPVVETASYVRVNDQNLRRQIEDTLIKFLKSNAVINQRQVDR